MAIECQSDSPFLEARGEVNYLEGFFCVLTHKKKDFRNVPPTVRVSVSTYSQRKDGGEVGASYRMALMQFDVQLLQKIVVPSLQKVVLNRSKNTASISVFSNVDFIVKALDPKTKQALNPYESPLKYSVTKENDPAKGLNAFSLKLSVTMETEDKDWLV